MSKRNRSNDFLDLKSHGYKIIDQYGEGSFGKVYLCTKIDNPDKMMYAAKIIDTTANQEDMK